VSPRRTHSRVDTNEECTVNATVHTSNNGTADVEIKIFNADGSELASHGGSSNTALTFQAESPELWSPDSPKLYNVTVTLGDDVVNSYTAFRTVSRGEVNGIQRPLLNGEFVFQFGTLDQGYWPDGLYTPPNREAMEYDLKMLKDLGFNMLRKHVSEIERDCPSEHSADRFSRSKSRPHCFTNPATSSA
jgi:beta-galactosidase/beta-glucuronidase